MRFERKFEALLLRVALRHFGLYASAGLGRGRGDGLGSAEIGRRQATRLTVCRVYVD